MVLRQAPIFQITDIASGIVKATLQQLGNVFPRFRAFLRSGVAGILPAHFVDQIAHPLRILKKLKETRVNGAE